MVPLISMMFNEFTNIIFVGLTCFLTKMSTKLKNRIHDIVMLYQHFIVQIPIKLNSFQYFVMEKLWKIVEEANEGMSIGFFAKLLKPIGISRGNTFFLFLISRRTRDMTEC